ncbi:MAG TPA: DUF4350 domain-containing protein [Actinocrinis sp.]
MALALAAASAVAALITVAGNTSAHADTSSPSGLPTDGSAAPTNAPPATPNGVNTSNLLQPEADDAMLNLLAQDNISYTPVTTLAAAMDFDGNDATLVIDSGEVLSRGELSDLTGDGQFARVVILNNDPTTLAALAPGVSLGQQSVESTGTVAPGCSEREAAAAGPVDLAGDTATFAVTGPAGTASPSATATPKAVNSAGSGSRVAAQSCYQVDGQPAMVVLNQSPMGGDVVVLGSETFTENEFLADDGNASLALQVFGRAGNLVWLAPDFTLDPALNNCSGGICGYSAQPGGDGSPAVTTLGAGGGGAGGAPPSLQSLMPAWIWWALAQLAIALLLIAYWRGRRHGRVVTEKLPVRVRASETIEGHARLYRRAKAHERAAELLRRATARRLAAYFGLPSDAAHHNPMMLTEPVAARLGVAPAQVAELLAGPAPASEQELVHLADRLDQLEREVRSS